MKTKVKKEEIINIDSLDLSKELKDRIQFYYFIQYKFQIQFDIL